MDFHVRALPRTPADIEAHVNWDTGPLHAYTSLVCVWKIQGLHIRTLQQHLLTLGRKNVGSQASNSRCSFCETHKEASPGNLHSVSSRIRQLELGFGSFPAESCHLRYARRMSLGCALCSTRYQHHHDTASYRVRRITPSGLQAQSKLSHAAEYQRLHGSAMHSNRCPSKVG